METLPGVAPPEQQNTYFYIGQHETKRTVPVTTELGNQAQDAGVSSFLIFFSIVSFSGIRLHNRRATGCLRLRCLTIRDCDAAFQPKF
jgi:hypothetical protein